MKAAISAFNAPIRRAEKAAIDAFVAAAIAGNIDAFDVAIEDVNEKFLWREAMSAISRRQVPHGLRAQLVFFWQKNGDTLRGRVGDDLVLIAGLRAILPKYSGEPKRLFQGETFYNRRRRTYGVSWTDRIEVAEDFASKAAKITGDACLLETLAPPEAIISSPTELSNRFEVEREYVVDRRKLTNVTVLRRFVD